MQVEATLRALMLFDVADGIQLDRVSGLLGGSTDAGVRSFGRAGSPAAPSPEYVRFERPPVIEHHAEARIRYYDYGVISVELDTAFSGDIAELVQASSRWISDSQAESRARDFLVPRVKRAISAMTNPYAEWVSEDYYLVLLPNLPGGAPEFVQRCGTHIAQIVRGESTVLADEERQDVLNARISYYPNDLAVIGWSAALICDTPTGTAPTVQLIEYANSQLLEYRHYDDLLTRVLADVYRDMDEGTGFWARWRMGRRAARLNTIRLEVIELTERTDNAIKFLSDMFYARLYRLAARRVGVPDYRNLVEQKLRTAGELYQFMTDQFQQGRAFVLEVMVVVILVIELAFLFRGK